MKRLRSLALATVLLAFVASASTVTANSMPAALQQGVGTSTNRGNGSGVFGYELLLSEITSTEGKLWLSQAGFGSVGQGQPMKVYDCVGALKDYTPEFAANVPGVRTYLGLRAHLAFVELAKGDSKWDKRSLSKATDAFLDNNHIPRDSDFAKRVRDALDHGEAPEFTMYARPVGLDYDDAPELTWNNRTGCFEGLMETTDLAPGHYTWELTYGFRGSRERIKMNIPIVSWFTGWKPTINRPHTENETQKDGVEFVICNGMYFTGIATPADLWKLTVDVRRSTFATHEGTSWREADTSGGYLEDIPVPPGFQAGQAVPAGQTTPPGAGLDPSLLNKLPGGGLPDNGKLPTESPTKREDPPKSPKDQVVTNPRLWVDVVTRQDTKAIRFSAVDDYSIKVTFSDGGVQVIPTQKKKDHAVLLLRDYAEATKLIITVGGAEVATLDMAELRETEVGKEKVFK